MRTTIPRLVASLSAAALLTVGCGGDDADPDPGSPGSETELDGGEMDTGNDGSSTSIADETGGGTEGTTTGATEGNQMVPGETTPQTAQDGRSPDEG